MSRLLSRLCGVIEVMVQRPQGDRACFRSNYMLSWLAVDYQSVGYRGLFFPCVRGARTYSQPGSALPSENSQQSLLGAFLPGLLLLNLLGGTGQGWGVEFKPNCLGTPRRQVGATEPWRCLGDQETRITWAVCS